MIRYLPAAVAGTIAGVSTVLAGSLSVHPLMPYIGGVAGADIGALIARTINTLIVRGRP